jgi:hypothetical protein
VILDADAADRDLGIAPREERRPADDLGLDVDDLDISPRGSGRGARDRAARSLEPEIAASRLPPAIEPLDPVGVIDAARISKLAPDDVWLDQTWVEPQVQEPTAGLDDDVTGPWPTAE